MHLFQGLNVSLFYFFFPLKMSFYQTGLPLGALVPEAMHVKSLKSIPPAKCEIIVFLGEEKCHRQVPGKTRTSFSLDLN